MSFSQEIETIRVHHFVPDSHEVLHEGLLGVAAGVDFGDGAELGVRSEDEVDDSGRPLELAGVAIASFQHVR